MTLTLRAGFGAKRTWHSWEVCLYAILLTSPTFGFALTVLWRETSACFEESRNTNHLVNRNRSQLELKG